MPVKSPGEALSMLFYQQKNAEGRMCLYYQVAYKDRIVIQESEFEIQLDNHYSEQAMGLPPERLKHWCENLVVKDIVNIQEGYTWEPVYGERSLVRDCYNETIIKLEKENNPDCELHLVVRAYDEGIAFRYSFPEDPRAIYYHVKSENTEFTFPSNSYAYFTSWAQGPYELSPLRDWPDRAERPLTLKLENGLYACLAEAEMVDYSRTDFRLSTDKPDTIVTSMYSSVDRITPFATPWRVIMVAEKCGDLLENNDILLNL